MANKVEVGGQFHGTINFAMQQNYVPIIKYIRISNVSGAVLENLKLKISFEPQFARPYETKIEQIQTDTPIEISPIHVILSPEYLLSLTEKIVGNINVEIFDENECIYSHDDTIELLAYDEWSGLLVMPEIISAFVTPNHPRISELVHKAETFLMKWTKDPSFSGYQTNNPRHVKLQMAAIYAALQEENIVYHMPPASYEKIGQRVRLVNSVLEQKKGTCLDLSILYASCLEAVGLHPILIFIAGHAFLGCWLEQDTFPDCIQDDISAITKRLAQGIDEICVVECTDYVVGKNVDFDKAEKHAQDHLLNHGDFLLAVDIMRSRGSGIRPIPMRSVQDGNYTAIDYGKQIDTRVTNAPQEAEMAQHILAHENVEVTKQKLWERKLLDLSLRNTLLNFRITKNAVQLMIADLSMTEDALAQREEFKVLARPNDWSNLILDSKIYEIENEKDLINSIAQAEFKSKRIRTFLSDFELEISMKSLYRQAKLSLEENGANTLYLALGFLRWFESDLSEKPRYAPIVLLPVEITRKVLDKSFIIRLRDEEPQMNITLLEMLRQDFGISIGGLDPLPSDDNGIDLPLIFNVIRQAVMAKKRWDVENLSFLGLFSFSQFIMWSDIHNRAEELTKNKIVSSLVSGKLEWKALENCIRAEELDAKLSPTDMAIPTSVDSSQLVAICAAEKGQSFVLHGPPGTGKSQTITNMIANALYQGKSVLFVAEKMAALSVVQKRLEAVGLAPFCLELHSNKAQKKNVLDQLGRTLEVGLIKKPEEYEATAKKLHQLRMQLNEVVNEIHKKRTFGISLYDAIIRYETLSEYYGKVKFRPEVARNLSIEQDKLWKELLNRYKIAAIECGGVKDTPFLFNQSRVYSMELRDGMKQALSNYWNILKQLKEAQKAIIAEFQFYPKEKHEDYIHLFELCQILQNSRKFLKPIIMHSDIQASDSYLTKIIENGQSMVRIEQDLVYDFDQSIFQYDVASASLRWKQAEAKWFLPKWLEEKKLLKELAVYAKSPERVLKDNILQIYQQLQKHMENAQVIHDVDASTAELYGVMWNQGHPDWEQLSQAYQDSKKLNLALKDIIFSKEERNVVLNRVVEITDQLENNQNIYKEKLEQYSRLINQLTTTEQQLQEQFHIRVEQLRTGTSWMEGALRFVERLLPHINGIKEWTTFLNLQDELSKAGLTDIIEAYHRGEIKEVEFLPGYECNISYAIISLILSESEVLAKFQGTQFEDTIENYKDVLEEHEILTVKELVSKLSAKLPRNAIGMASSSEIGILQKAIKSGGRMMTIRKLFDSIPTLLRRLCPCMLMSPMSVAQYIDPRFPKFDLVIFDEASQLPTCEAVGAIARGDNVVVVGDPKQLPPTSFFTSNRIDEENYDKEDLESLLDDCLALSMPQEHLLWHYRSRHESLIAYSNMKYYDNKLYTFPSPEDVKSEVKLIPIEGFYEKGGTKQNRAEAEAVIAEIIRRLSDEELRKDSIGVVTFSSVQQNLIDDMLMEAFQKNPELEKINNESLESIFIKNLENVQGDERDVILFSIGYGPDKDGKVSMNFGPLNRDGGWRRLNVAISRARKKMLVYSVLKPEQIDLTRTRSEGVEGLKGFLEFASKGNNVLAIRNGLQAEKRINIQELIANRLKVEGYDVKCNIGCSEYKIDIGLIHPQNKDAYILGIMCDGENYMKAKTARDRNILQPKVLKGLGWNILSVWTMDWLDNPEKVMLKIKEAIQMALKNEENKGLAVKETITHAKAEVLIFEKVIEDVESHRRGVEYKAAELKLRGVQDNFYDPNIKYEIAECMKEIIQREAPISKRLLYKKTMNSWGISRSGSRVEGILDQLLTGLNIKVTKVDNTQFCWRQDQMPDQYRDYRIATTEEEKRSMDDISPEEISNAIKTVIELQVSLSRTDLIRETAKLFGFTRMGNVIELAVNHGIKEALQREWICLSEDGEKVSIPIR